MQASAAGSIFQLLPSYTTAGQFWWQTEKNLKTVIYIWSLQHLLHATQMHPLSDPAV